MNNVKWLVSTLPVKGLLLDFVNKANQKQEEKDHHGTKDQVRVFRQHVLVNNGPRVKKNHFHVEQDEEHGNEVKFDRKTGTSLTNRLHTTFIRRVLDAGTIPFFARQGGEQQGPEGKGRNQSEQHQNRYVLRNLRFHLSRIVKAQAHHWQAHLCR